MSSTFAYQVSSSSGDGGGDACAAGEDGDGSPFDRFEYPS